MKESVKQSAWIPAVIVGLILLVVIYANSDASLRQHVEQLEHWRVDHQHAQEQQMQLLNDIRMHEAVQAKASQFMEDWLKSGTKNGD